MIPRFSAASLALVALVAALAACSKGAPPPSSEAPQTAPDGPKGGIDHASASPVVPLDTKAFGSAITEATTTPLTALAEDPAKFGGKTVKTEGMVTAVCQAMGCWMEIGSETKSAHIKMVGHSFFVPKTASGHRAVVQGTVAAAAAGNECKDGCGPEKTAKVEIEATGIQFVD